MNINVTRTEVIVGNGYIVNKGEYKINPCIFTFSQDYTSNLVKKAVFDDGKTIKEMAIINNRCEIPYDVLDSDSFQLKVYAYRVNEQELELVYSPTPAKIYLREGSYRGVTGSGEIITPTQYEQYEQALNDGLEELEAGLEEVSNVDIDVSKSGNTATVTITDRQGTEKSVEIFDGDDYVLTEEDKQEIINTVEAEVSLDIPTKVSQLENDSAYINKEVNNLTNYTLKTNTGSSIELSINSSTYVMTLNLKNSAGTTISTGTIDLPLETMVVGATYDNTNKKIVLTLKNGNTIDVPVADLVSGLQSEITSANKLSADLVDDTNSTHKFTNTTEKSGWNAKYDKPSGGIPKADLDSSVQTSLGKADTAIQDVSGKEDKTNKTDVINENSTDKQYPNAQAVYNELLARDEKISNLKTKNKLLVKDHVPIENTGTSLQLTNTGDLPMSILPYGNIEQENFPDDYQARKLPNEYQSVEYIESTGTQYINTNYTPNSTEDIIDIYGSYQGSDVYSAIFGVLDGSSHVWALAKTSTANQFRLSVNGDILFNFTDYKSKHHYKADKNNLYIDGDLVATGSAGNEFSIPVYLFARNYNGTANQNGNWRMYSCKIYSNNTLVRDFVPCYRKSDNVIGLYDFANNVFYTNSGTGNFIKGSDTDLSIPVKVVDGEYTNSIYSENILDYSTLSSSTSSYTDIKVDKDGYIIIKNNSDSSNGYASIDAKNTKIIPGNSYTLRAEYIGLTKNIFFQNANNDYTKYVSNNTNNTVTNTAITNFMRLTITIGAGETLKVRFTIVEGTVGKNYVKPAEQNITIDTSPNPLYSEDDHYEYFTSEEAIAFGLNAGEGWYCYNEYYKERLTNCNSTTGTSNNYYRQTLSTSKISKQCDTSNNTAYCNILKMLEPDGTYSGVSDGFTITASGDFVMFSNTTKSIDSTSDMNTWLQNNELIACYPLVTPTYTKVTDTNLINSLNTLQDLKSYYDITNINQTHATNQADMRINAKALKSLKAMQSEIDELKQAILNS